MLKRFLITPGPTPVPPEVLSALGEPVIHHRAPRFTEILTEVVAGLKYVYQTQNDIMVFAASGTGAMEAAVVNVVNPGDKVIVASVGNFGERWKKLTALYGADVVALDYEWGTKADPADIRQALADNPDVKAVYCQFSETSTGVVNDIKTIGEIVAATPAILVVDAISGLGATDLKTDDWHVDICVAGSQKALMVPPGLAYAAVSDKAWAVVDECTQPRFYFDYVAMRKKMTGDSAQTPYTPAVSLMVAQNRAIQLIREEGLENVFARHRVLGAGLQGRRQGARSRAVRPGGPRSQLRDRGEGAGGRGRRQDRQDRPRQVRRVAGRRPGPAQGQDLPLRPLRLLRPLRHHRRPGHGGDGAGRARLRRALRRGRGRGRACVHAEPRAALRWPT